MPACSGPRSETLAICCRSRDQTLPGRAAGVRGRAKNRMAQTGCGFSARLAPTIRPTFHGRRSLAAGSYSECPIASSSSGHNRPPGEEGTSRSIFGIWPRAACLSSSGQLGKADAGPGALVSVRSARLPGRAQRGKAEADLKSGGCRLSDRVVYVLDFGLGPAYREKARRRRGAG
jgi:hypothetical protein